MLTPAQLQTRIEATQKQILTLDETAEPLDKQLREIRAERRRLRSLLDIDYDRLKLATLKAGRHPDRRTISLLEPDDANISETDDKGN